MKSMVMLVRDKDGKQQCYAGKIKDSGQGWSIFCFPSLAIANEIQSDPKWIPKEWKDFKPTEFPMEEWLGLMRENKENLVFFAKTEKGLCCHFFKMAEIFGSGSRRLLMCSREEFVRTVERLFEHLSALFVAKTDSSSSAFMEFFTRLTENQKWEDN